MSLHTACSSTVANVFVVFRVTAVEKSAASETPLPAPCSLLPTALFFGIYLFYAVDVRI